MDISKIKNYTDLFVKTYSPDARLRRLSLIDAMSELEEQGTDCSKCSGFCCTYYHNSMQVTPLEAIDIINELITNERLTKELIEKLKTNVKKYRLDNEITDGRGRVMRRYYTCPFFNDTQLGCSLGRASKPYGCLAFNATEKNVSTEGKCKSQLELLEKREIEFSDKESALNEHLKSSLKLYWNKKAMPQALLEVMLQMSI